MEAALDSIRDLAASNDDERRRALVALQKLSHSLETTHDTIWRYGHLHLQSAMVQVGVELGLFRHLSSSNEPLTPAQVAEKTGAEEGLIVRTLRYLAAINAVDEDENDKGRYKANHTTRNLSEPVAEAGLATYFHLSAPPFQAIPAYLKETNYRNPDDGAHTAFHAAFHTDKSLFGWFADHPEHLAPFNTYMALHRKQTAGLDWLSVYPVETEAVNWSAERPLYVDIGGGIGHQCAQFKERFPHLAGRVVLQDLPHSIARALQTPGVENMAHDFFEEQPVKGAKFYYIHAVVHNLTRGDVRRLLENTKAAMAPDSVLLIDERVLPDAGVNAVAASVDLTMLSTLASMERSETEWRRTLAEVGLEIVKMYTYNPQTYETVMHLRPTAQAQS